MRFFNTFSYICRHFTFNTIINDIRFTFKAGNEVKVDG